MGLVRVPLIAVTVALVGTMLPFGSVCQASNDMKLWLAPGSINDSKPNVALSVIFRVKGILAGVKKLNEMTATKPRATQD